MAMSTPNDPLGSLEQTLTILKEKRSYYIAHLSKKLLMTGGLEQPVYTDDLNKVY